MHRNKHAVTNCACKSTDRALVLLAQDFPETYPELLQPGLGDDWTYYPELNAVRIEVGAGRMWGGVAEVFNFLRGVLVAPERLAALRAVWVERTQPLAAQVLRLIHAEPLLKLAPTDSTPLTDILTNRRIESWYQPVIDARTNRVWGYECLMRGRTRDGELVGAPQMLAWAQQENLTFMLDRVCREVHLENAGSASADADADTFFLINFLPTAIYQPEFCLQTSMAAAARSGLSPQRIIFEVVETEKVSDPEHLKRILTFYRDSGFRVALDDMGSGYSGLTLLGDLQPDLVKIDRALVSKAAHSSIHRGICASLIKLCKEHGLLALAEGVETEAEQMVMEELGVDLYQGYYFGRPARELLPSSTSHTQRALPEFSRELQPAAS